MITYHGLIRTSVSTLIVLLALLHVAGILELPLISKMEKAAYDIRLNLTLPDSIDQRIVIVDVDEPSLIVEGHWPWPRNKLAILMDNLFAHYQVSLVAFDVVFAESDQSSGLSVLKQLAKDELRNDAMFIRQLQAVTPQLEYDRLFADSIRGRAVILGYTESSGQDISGELPVPVANAKEPPLAYLPLNQAKGYSANLPILQNSALGAGYFNNASVDEDGAFRRVALVQRIGDNIYESLSLAAVRAFLGSPPLHFNIKNTMLTEQTDIGLERLEFGGLSIPVDAQAAALIPYLGTQGSFPYVSASEVLHKRADKDLLKDTIVLVGSTAVGLQDLRSTPVQNIFPGVEIQANMISGMLDQRIKSRPTYLLGVEFVLLLVLGLLVTVLFPLLTPLWVLLLTVVMALIIVAVNLYFWSQAHMVLPLASPLLLLAVLFINHMSYGFFIESRSKRLLSSLFGQYIPPELVDELSSRETRVDVTGENRDMTVLFMDVRSFTTISERLEPKEVARFINCLLTPMTQIIHSYRGTIDKYLGDGLMAFWGAPLRDEQHAKHAVQAAMQMLERVQVLRDEFEQKGWPVARIGIGLSTGPMNVGNMGSEFRMAYTVLGDAVNLGARLESLTKTYRVDLIVSENTCRQVPDYAFRELDRVRVKGKKLPVAIFQPVAPLDSLSVPARQFLDKHQRAITLYGQQQWEQALALFHELGEASPEDRLYEVYVERCHYFRQNPPGAAWDGVFTGPVSFEE